MHALSWSYCATHSTAQFTGYGRNTIGNSSGDSFFLSFSDFRRVLDTGSATLDNFAARTNRGLQECSATSMPQRPFSPDSSSSGAADRSSAGSAEKSKEVRNLRSSQKQTSASNFSQAASSVMPSNFPAVVGASMPLSLCPSHTAGSVFLPTTPVDIPFPECLRLEGDSVSMSCVFRMALICCIVARWIKIAGALSMWTSRLRLKFFESPLNYKNSTKSSKLGRIGVFWDLENCPVPSGRDIPTVIDKVRAIANTFGEIQCFRAYGKLDYLTRQAVPFLSKDVELCPVPDGKESADKAIILDAGLFAFDHKPCPGRSEDSQSENDAVVIVTGDRGFAALLQELSKRNITTIVIGNAHQTLPSVLGQSANFSLDWEDMMINDKFDIDLFDKFSESLMSCCQKLQSGEGVSMGTICCADESDHEAETSRMNLQDLSDVDCYQLDSAGSELLCTTSSELPCPLVKGFPKVISHGSTAEVMTDGMVMKTQLLQDESTSSDSVDGNKLNVPIGGKIRVLRHLRCEVAAIADKFCNKGTRIDLREFARLYQVEMGHALVPGHYGCGGLKNLLESMPDLISLRPSSKNSSELEIFPFYPKGRSSYGKVNYTREDLRCILYELLRTKWPSGVKKEHLSTEHIRITGRPFVLTTYEFLKTGDVFGSMRDIVYIDPRTKQLHLVNGAQEPAGYTVLAQNQWS